MDTKAYQMWVLNNGKDLVDQERDNEGGDRGNERGHRHGCGHGDWRWRKREVVGETEGGCSVQFHNPY